MTNIRKIEATKLFGENAVNIIKRIKISAAGGNGSGNITGIKTREVSGVGVGVMIEKVYQSILKGGAIGGSRLHRGIGYKIRLEGIFP
ncbi:hypothetical protein X943_002845 [Babesia divergens]|uniref:Uncharacterized protein n=1 Tax=Babesia divergens TaxID=32595 RepID=A0AAD9G5G5_BABDI|nr:hypothetical protein X943_002845 [Babesia divergens]